MNQHEQISVRFVCPWRDCRPNDVRQLPFQTAVDLIRVHVAIPAGIPAQRSVETTAGVAPTMIETRVLSN